MKYPKWQTKIRKAQQERDENQARKQRERDAAREAQEAEQLRIAVERWETVFKKYEFTEYPVPLLANLVWKHDDYTFEIDYSTMKITRNQDLSMFEEHNISFEDEVDYYNEKSTITINNNYFSLVTLADKLDELDRIYDRHQHENQQLVDHILYKREKQKLAEEKKANAPEPVAPVVTTQDKLYDTIRLIVEEILSDAGIEF